MNNCICGICNNIIQNEIQTSCNHHFCFICLKNYCKNNNYTCPNCNADVDKERIVNFETNLFYLSKIYWIYSANYNNANWCYDKKANNRLEILYNNYLQSKNHYSQQTNEKESVLKTLNKNISPYDESKRPRVDYSLIENINLYNCGIEKYNNNNSQNGTNEIINCDINTTSIKLKSVKLPLSSKLKIGSTYYIINFDKMKQINSIDINKQRKIKRVEIPDEIVSTDKCYKYLVDNYNVKGVSGIIYK